MTDHRRFFRVIHTFLMLGGLLATVAGLVDAFVRVARGVQRPQLVQAIQQALVSTFVVTGVTILVTFAEVKVSRERRGDDERRMKRNCVAPPNDRAAAFDGPLDVDTQSG